MNRACRRASIALAVRLIPCCWAAPVRAQSDTESDTATPIKHVIVLIGENRTFDNVFGTYVPREGQRVSNLLSKGIVESDGSPDKNAALAAQF